MTLISSIMNEPLDLPKVNAHWLYHPLQPMPQAIEEPFQGIREVFEVSDSLFGSSW